ncbi:MAG TPA: CHAD domain-containing protein [Candidatus Acidoferrum sp.]|nr:CHAD domain-containing protein [Candidatus Acidoferrum sp.]
MGTPVAASRSPLPLTLPCSPSAMPAAGAVRSDYRDLAHWMGRVLEERAALLASPKPDTVHDLRVAIRHCRSLASVMERFDPDPAWQEMRKAPRKMFRTLGEWRENHVLRDWTKKLGSESDPLRERLLASLEEDEKLREAAARRACERFDEKEWMLLERRLRRRVRIVPPGGLAAECLVLELFEESKELHNLALRTEKAKPWHALRVGVKRFRYSVQSLLPEQYAAWSKNLKRLQDLLGDVHDLDVLAKTLEDWKQPADGEQSESVKNWQERIAQERREHLETYRRLTLGKTSLWSQWRHQLPHGVRLEAASTARLRATVRAGDKHARRTAQVSRLALRIYELLRRKHAAPLFEAGQVRRLLEAASLLHGITPGSEGTLSPKELRKYILEMAVLPNWTREEWDLVAWIVRFHRGPEPKQKNGFARLAEADQTTVRGLAGILRLARVLRKCGVAKSTGLRLEVSEDAFVLGIPGLVDNKKNAARLGAAKHLLESVLPKPLLLKALPKPDRSTRTKESAPETPLLFAVAAG